MDRNGMLGLALICVIVAGVGGQAPAASPTSTPATPTTPSVPLAAPAKAPAKPTTPAPVSSPPAATPVASSPKQNVPTPVATPMATPPPAVTPVSSPPAPVPVSSPPAKSPPSPVPVAPPTSSPVATPTAEVPAPTPSKKKPKKKHASAPGPALLSPPAPPTEGPGPSAESMSPGSVADEVGPLFLRLSGGPTTKIKITPRLQKLLRAAFAAAASMKHRNHVESTTGKLIADHPRSLISASRLPLVSLLSHLCKRRSSPLAPLCPTHTEINACTESSLLPQIHVDDEREAPITAHRRICDDMHLCYEVHTVPHYCGVN